MVSSAKLIVKGEPKEIGGFVKRGREMFVLVKWTTGNSYIPYDLAKEYFPTLLMDYIFANPRVIDS